MRGKNAPAKEMIHMKLIDLKTLSERTSISVFTYRKYVKFGMPHYRVGRKILVDWHEIEVWFERFKSDCSRPEDNLGLLVDETLQKIS